MIRLVVEQIKALSGSFVKVAFRSKGMVGILLAGIILMILTNLMANLYIGERARILQTSGFFIVGLWGLLTSVYLGATVVNKEIQDKTIYLFIVRPMSRSTYLMGKWSGVVATLFFIFVGISTVFLLNLRMNGVAILTTHFVALTCIYMEWVILSTFSMMFSTFTTPFLNGLFVSSVWMLGHLSNDILVYYRNVSNHSYAIFLKVIHVILPNLEAMNFRSEVIYGKEIGSGLFIMSVGVGLLWVVTVLMLANLIFSIRKLS